jgi:hypothetical protein
MGTKNFFSQKARTIAPSGQNLQARAIGASGFTAGRQSGSAVKDIAASKAAATHGLKATTKTAATNAPGPKKV